MKYLIISLIVFIIFITVAISKTPESNNNVAENYLTEINKTAATSTVNSIEKLFLNLFGDFKTGVNEKVIRAYTKFLL